MADERQNNKNETTKQNNMKSDRRFCTSIRRIHARHWNTGREGGREGGGREGGGREGGREGGRREGGRLL